MPVKVAAANSARDNIVAISGADMPQETSAIGRWIKDGLSAGTILTILSIWTGLAVTHGRDEARMDSLEDRIKLTQMQARADQDRSDRWLSESITYLRTEIAELRRAVFNASEKSGR